MLEEEERIDEGMDTTSAMISTLENGTDEEVGMLLGGRERIRHSGIIRVGKQAPLKRCTPEEKALFTKLEAEGVPYDEINRAMGGQPKSRDSKLTMTNTDHFVIHEYDFKRPSDAEHILRDYASSDGKVREIPVYFSVGDIDKAIPHGFRAFDGKGQLRCMSFYDHSILKFRYVERSVDVVKSSDWKVLDSEDPDMASKACGLPVTFKGMYRLHVAGCSGIGEVLVPNGSWYGMGDAVEVLEKLVTRYGKFDGLLGGKPFLKLCKVQEMVKHKGEKKKQWIVTLDLIGSLEDLERYYESSAVAARADNARARLTGRRVLSEMSIQRASNSQSHTPPPSNSESTANPPVGPENGAQKSSLSATETKTTDGDKRPYDPKVAIGVLVNLVTPHGISLNEISIYAASQGLGQEMADMTRDEMHAFYKLVYEGLRLEKDDFIAKIKEIAGGVS